jgi:glutamate synthase (NADPH/NADH)
MVDLDKIVDESEIQWLKSVIQEHHDYTGSGIAKRILDNFPQIINRFVKVFPRDYKAVLLAQSKMAQKTSSSSVAAKEPSIADIEDGGMNKNLDVTKLDKMKGFMKYQRQTDKYRNPHDRIKDWKEVNARLSNKELKVQAARCMGMYIFFLF